MRTLFVLLLISFGCKPAASFEQADPARKPSPSAAAAVKRTTGTNEPVYQEVQTENILPPSPTIVPLNEVEVGETIEETVPDAPGVSTPEVSNQRMQDIPRKRILLYAAAKFSSSVPFTDHSGLLNCPDKDMPGCQAAFREGESVTVSAPAQLQAMGRLLRFRYWICHDIKLPFPSHQANLCENSGALTCTVAVTTDLICSGYYE